MASGSGWPNSGPQTVYSSGGWEREVIEKLAMAAVQEQRRARRWGIFFKMLFAGYLLLLVGIGASRDGGLGFGGDTEHTALVDLQGVIAQGEPAGADNIVPALKAAFDAKGTKAVILRINSPGGSPVQAGYIYREMRRLRGLHPEIPLYAVIQDVGASAAYYIAAGADKIYADPASMVGSIGVLMDGFGFVGTMDKLGVERRLITAGEHKGLLDPFSPPKEEETQFIRSLLAEVHEQFIDAVKKGRGARLGNDPQLFSGLVWSGEKAVKMGLIDALGSSGYVAREVIKVEKVVDYTRHDDFFDRVGRRLGSEFAGRMAAAFGMQPQMR